MPVKSFGATVEMISAACAELGERALIYVGANDIGDTWDTDRVKIAGAMNHATIFPACRAVVHHGGAGTTATGMRAGVPTLILWVTADQPIWAAEVKRLGVGSARRFSSTTKESLVAELRRILAPRYFARARDVATRMTEPGESVTATADLLEKAASPRADQLMGTVVVVALAMATDPMRLGVTLLLISRRRPILNLFVYWLGVMFVGVSSGVMVLTVLRDFAPTLLRNLSLLAANPTVRHVQVVVGLLLLLLAALVSSRMPVRQRLGLRVPVPGVVPVPVGITDDPPSLLLQPIATPTGMSQWMGRARSMFKGESLWVALAAGLGQGPAPPEYLVALVAILASRANIGTQIGLAVMFNLIMLGVCELTLHQLPCDANENRGDRGTSARLGWRSSPPNHLADRRRSGSVFDRHRQQLRPGRTTQPAGNRDQTGRIID